MRASRFAWFAAGLALVLGVAATSVPASAQVYVGGRASVFLPNSSSDGLSGFDTGGGVEGFAGIPIAQNLALEAGAGYCRTKWSDSDDVIREESTVSAVPLTLTAKGFVPLGDRGRIYAGAGVGAYFATADVEGSWKEVGEERGDSDSSNDTAFGYHVVFGGEFTVAPRLNLDAQIKWFRAEPSFSFFDGATSAKVDIGGVMLSVGLLFNL